MKRIIAKTLLAGLMVSAISAPLEALSWGEWFKNGLSSMGRSISQSSTETKVLVGLSALLASGLGYLLYRYLNPTDQELLNEANEATTFANNFLTLLPVIQPLDETLLNTIALNLLFNRWTNPHSLSSELLHSIKSLQKQQDIIELRIIKYHTANKYTPIELSDCRDTIANLITQLKARRTIIDAHAQYFRLCILENGTVQRFSEVLTERANMPALVPMIKRIDNLGRFKFLAFAKEIHERMIAIEQELALNYDYGAYYNPIYMSKKIVLRQLKSHLKVLETTILGSKEHADDQANKEAWEKYERDEAIKKEANRIAAQKAADEKWAREEKIRIERERLRLEQEKNQREREKAAREAVPAYAPPAYNS